MHHEHRSYVPSCHRAEISVEFHPVVTGMEQNRLGELITVLPISERTSQKFHERTAIAV